MSKVLLFSLLTIGSGRAMSHTMQPLISWLSYMPTPTLEFVFQCGEALLLDSVPFLTTAPLPTLLCTSHQVNGPQTIHHGSDMSSCRPTHRLSRHPTVVRKMEVLQGNDDRKSTLYFPNNMLRPCKTCLQGHQIT